MTPHESAYEWGITARPKFQRGPFKEMRMTDAEWIAVCRDEHTDAYRAEMWGPVVDRLEAITAERDAARAVAERGADTIQRLNEKWDTALAEVERLNQDMRILKLNRRLDGGEADAETISDLRRKARKWKRRAKEAEAEAKTAYATLDEVRAAARDEALEEAAEMADPLGSEYGDEQRTDFGMDRLQLARRIRALKHPRSGSERAQEADTQLLCAGGCGRPYSDGPDVLIPDEAWLKIAPRPDGGGVLCPNCMDDRLRAAGYDHGQAPGFFMSGPMCSNDPPFRLVGPYGKRVWTAQTSTERAAEADTTPSPAVGGAEPACEHSWLCRDGKTWECDWCGTRRADSAEPEKVASGPDWRPYEPVCGLGGGWTTEEKGWWDQGLMRSNWSSRTHFEKLEQPKPLATDQWPACEVCRQPLIPDAYVQTGVHRAKHAGCCTVDVKSQDAGRADTSGQDREAAHRPVDGVAPSIDIRDCLFTRREF